MKLGENRKKRPFQHSRLPRFKVRRSLECLWCPIFRFSPIFFFSCSGKCINFFNLQPFPKNKDLNFSVQPLGGFGQKNRCPSFYAGYCTPECWKKVQKLRRERNTFRDLNTKLFSFWNDYSKCQKFFSNLISNFFHNYFPYFYQEIL